MAPASDTSSAPGADRAPVPRIAVTCAGDPADVTAFSGSPAGLLRALGGLGVEAMPVRGDLGPRGQVWFERALVASHLRPRHAADLRASRVRLREQAIMSPLMPGARRLAAARRLEAVGPLDGIVQYGTEFDLPAGVPYVTIEDSTFLQSVPAFDWPWLRGASPRLIEAFGRQAARRYGRARACCFMSDWAARSCVEDYAVPASRVHVVGVGRHHTPPCPDRDWSRPRALFVGRDWERKNGPAVLRAFAALRDEHPDAELDVVGEHPRLDVPGVAGHGPLSLADPDQRARAEACFAAATFFVMPSRHEPAGIVYAEAQAAGLASIGTTSGGAATVIGDGGVLVEPDDHDGLLDAMRRLARPATAAELGARARARAPLFTWEAVAGRLLRALEPPGLDVSRLPGFLPGP